MNPEKTLSYILVCLLALFVIAMVGVSGADSAGAGKSFTPEELDQMLAPIALYPDSLLAQILIASTYPLEVVQADRWVKQNSNLKGESLYTALDKMDWDPSIKALVPFPTVLSMMSEQLDWTQKLGDAFLARQDDVMQEVQKLRAEAKAQNNLNTTGQQQVIVEQKIIRIEPADPQVIYVPAYNPVVVYGPWWYPAYPPYYWGPRVAAPGLAFAAGVAVGAAWCHGWGNWNWGNHTINVNVNKNININHNVLSTNVQTNKWEHNPDHRKGVAYRDDTAKQRYGQKYSGSTEARHDYRGYSQTTGARDFHETQSNFESRTSESADKFKGSSSESRYQETASRNFGESKGSAFEGFGHSSEVRGQSERGSMSRESSMRGFGGRGGFRR